MYEFLKQNKKIEIIKRITDNSAFIRFNEKKYFIYHAKYTFKELKETNIPLIVFKRIPKNMKRIIILYKGSLYHLLGRSFTVK